MNVVMFLLLILSAIILSHFAECHYTEGSVCVFMQIVASLRAIKLTILMLYVTILMIVKSDIIVLSFVTLSDNLHSLIMLSVVLLCIVSLSKVS
jgi:hypothetical protein